MKSFLLLFTLIFSPLVLASSNELKFNGDVFNCQGQIKSLFELEKNANVYQVNAEGITINENNIDEAANNQFLALKNASAIRAELFKDVATPNEKIVFRKKIKIVRSSPASNIILPAGCSVEPISTVTMTEDRQYKVDINQDLYDLLSVEGKLTFLMALSLDIEQLISTPSWWKLDDINLNLIQSREFLACWFNETCRPKTEADFHKIVKAGTFNFRFYDQDHVIIDKNWGRASDVVFDEETGLIVKAKYVLKNIYGNRTPALTSSYVYRGVRVDFEESLASKEVSFNKKGKVSCVPIRRNIQVKVFNDGQPITLFAPCWREDGTISSGQFYFFPSNKPPLFYDIKVDGVSFKLPDGPTTFSLYADESLKWITADIALKFNNQMFSQSGMLSLYPSGKVRCIQSDKNTVLKTPNGQKVSMVTKPPFQKTDLFCFKEDGNFLQSYDTYLMEAMESI